MIEYLTNLDLFYVMDTKTKQPVKERIPGGGIWYFDCKPNAKRARAMFNREAGCEEKLGDNGEVVMQYRYQVKRGPRHGNGGTS